MSRRPVLVIFALLLAACQASSSISTSATAVPLPPGDYASAVWLEEDQIILIRDSEVWGYNSIRGTISLVWAAQDSRCKRYVRFSFSMALPDGNLGLLERCGGRFPEELPPKSDECYIMELDLQQQRITQLVRNSMPPCSVAGPHEFTWNPLMTRGLESVGGLYSTLYWITPEGYEPLELRLTSGIRSWSLQDSLEVVLGDRDNTQVGVADSPEWSPDGSTIAFLASFDAIGRSGPDRVEGEYALYLMNPENLKLDNVLAGLENPRDIAWSPDGQRLALTSLAGVTRTDGIWTYTVGTGSLDLIQRGTFSSVVWSPSGDSIAALKCIGPTCVDDELWIWGLTPGP